MNNIDINKIWDILDGEINESTINNIRVQSHHCKICNSIINNESICNNCGLIIGKEYSNHQFEEPIAYKSSSGNIKLKKMQEWTKWTNEEKSNYKLNKYIKNLCNQLQIQECMIDIVCHLVLEIMNAIKNNQEGPKRSRVKDGIIILCIYYISKNTSIVYSYKDLAKKINLNIKYISKADNLLMELINNKKLSIPTELLDNFYKTDLPIDYVKRIIYKYNLNINEPILNQIVELINICNDNDILLDHTPLSIGVCCFYYILYINNIDINLKMFSELYDLSMVTILKTFNKLKKYKKKLEKLGIKQLT